MDKLEGRKWSPGVTRAVSEDCPHLPSRDPGGRIRWAVKLHPCPVSASRPSREACGQQSTPGTSWWSSGWDFTRHCRECIFQSLVGELESHTPCGQGIKPQNRANVVTNSTKTLKMVTSKKNLFFKKKASQRNKSIFSTPRGQCGTKLEGGCER